VLFARFPEKKSPRRYNCQNANTEQAQSTRFWRFVAMARTVRIRREGPAFLAECGSTDQIRVKCSAGVSVLASSMVHGIPAGFLDAFVFWR